MAKTLPPGIIPIPGVANFVANAVPDPFDERDLVYRPRLEPLPAILDQRDEAENRFVLLQKGNSCTGHAVAAVINTILARMFRNGQQAHAEPSAPTYLPPVQAHLPRVSPYMLYRLGRRYDEFEGEEDLGSSLRGVFKGWFYHGVALEEDWPGLEKEWDLDHPDLIEKSRDRPLGAFYRVNPYRLDDMQSAISELKGIAVSAAIHNGWIQPVVMRRGSDTMYVIARPANALALGGHAFALVGYNEVGFLVQNSWGPEWGKGGFATLPYEDWLDSAYDAWVARPGVPRTPFASGRSRTASVTGGGIATGPGLDKRRLAVHAVNLGNQGLLSITGQFVSTPTQIENIFDHMDRWHKFWLERDPTVKRAIVLYAHGGMVSEKNGLEGAQRDLNWWLNNRIYPIYFAWQTGPAETLMNQLVELAKNKLPFGGLGFDLVEQFDRWIEKLARSTLRWMWDEMKENARAASQPIKALDQVQWPPPSVSEQQAMAGMPGASLTVTRLAEYVRKHGPNNVSLHLVGHSAGSIFHAALLQRLIEAKLKVESMTLLSPAIRIDEFRRDILPHLGEKKTVARFAVFNLTDKQELDDALPPGSSGLKVYHKSLLYLVSRGLEPTPGSNTFEVPLLGMQRYFDQPLDDGKPLTVQAAINKLKGDTIFAPAADPAYSRSAAASHVDFDDDSPTLTSVLMRILGVKEPRPEYNYRPNAALSDADHAPSLDRPSPPPAVPEAAAPFTPATQVEPPGEMPLVETAEPQTEQPTPPPQPAPIVAEVAVAPRSGSPIVDVLEALGWTVEESAPTLAGPEKETKKGKRKKGKK